MTQAVESKQHQSDVVHALEARNVHYLVLPVLAPEQAHLDTTGLIRAPAQKVPDLSSTAIFF